MRATRSLFDPVSSRSAFSFQKLRIKCPRQQLFHLNRFDPAFQIRHYHWNVAAEFPDYLATHSARGRKLFSVSDHGDVFDLSLTARDRLPYRHALCANGEPVAGRLNIASRDHFTIVSFKRRADTKVRKGGVCILAHLGRSLYQ